MPKGKKSKTGRQDAPRQTPLQWLRAERLPLATCGVAFLIYSRSLFCGFEGDDFPQIVNNRQVQSWEYLPKLLGSNLWSQLSDRPGVVLSSNIFRVDVIGAHLRRTCSLVLASFEHLAACCGDLAGIPHLPAADGERCWCGCGGRDFCRPTDSRRRRQLGFCQLRASLFDLRAGSYADIARPAIAGHGPILTRTLTQTKTRKTAVQRTVVSVFSTPGCGSARCGLAPVSLPRKRE